MGTGVYYLCGKQGNIIMDRMEERNLNKWKGSMNKYLQKAKSHPQFRLKAVGWHWRKLFDPNIPPFQKEAMQSACC